jgi:hypothetical protein
VLPTELETLPKTQLRCKGREERRNSKIEERSDDAAQQVEQQMSGQRSEGMRPPLRDLLLHTSRQCTAAVLTTELDALQQTHLRCKGREERRNSKIGAEAQSL